MTMSLEQFQSALARPDLRAGLSLPLSDIEAEQVAADPASTRSWYDYWLSLQPATPPVAPPFDAEPPTGPAGFSAAPPPQYTAPHPSPSPQTAPVPADAQATLPYAGTGYNDPAYAATAAYPDAGHAGFGYPGAAQIAGAPGLAAPPRRNVGLWVTLSILGALLLIVAIVVVTTFATARTWTKVDVPEQPETFHSETYETGRFDVTMDAVNPCFVDQDWTDCTNLLVANYNAACVGVELTENATILCDDYNGAILEMQAQDTPGSYVATLGTYGNLTRTPETDVRQVSNDDYRPAETHEATCYLGFIGECE
ncbi:hypothetical protein [Microbacterium sp. NPDC089695]|uniref:hypothetical protein n=1 Tax=Microbacterium sp. NPDC089695 TaxID=3364198 RepID=UPI0037F21B19